MSKHTSKKQFQARMNFETNDGIPLIFSGRIDNSTRYSIYRQINRIHEIGYLKNSPTKKYDIICNIDNQIKYVTFIIIDNCISIEYISSKQRKDVVNHF